VPWTVVGQEAGADSASVTGEFVLSREVPAAVSQWPADFRLRVTYRLTAHALTVEATVVNLGTAPLPWGLGYHGYFTLPGAASADDLVLRTWANGVWQADGENLPTGQILPPPAGLDFRRPQRIGATHLDHVFTNLTGGPQVARLETAPPGGPSLTITASPGFRELVLFTPPHRKAVAVEPYTCSADAATLAARGVDSGWRTLPPGDSWAGTVGYTVAGL
jgi:aldose 1-epimerase